MEFPVFPRRGRLCYQDCGCCGQRSHLAATAWTEKKVDLATTELTVAGKPKCCCCGSDRLGAVVMDNGGVLELEGEEEVAV